MLMAGIRILVVFSMIEKTRNKPKEELLVAGKPNQPSSNFSPDLRMQQVRIPLYRRAFSQGSHSLITPHPPMMALRRQQSSRLLFSWGGSKGMSTNAPTEPKQPAPPASDATADSATADASTTTSTNGSTSTTAPPNGSATPAPAMDTARVQELEKQLKELKDHYLRALADQENLRERTRREKEMAQQLAIKGFAKDLASVADVLEIALNSVPEEQRKNDDNPHLKSLYTGLHMTVAELIATFKRHGFESFDPIGTKFDPNLHQAMFQAPVPDKEAGTVFAVTKKGYMLHGIVIRAAQVGIVQEQ